LRRFNLEALWSLEMLKVADKYCQSSQNREGITSIMKIFSLPGTSKMKAGLLLHTEPAPQPDVPLQPPAEPEIPTQPIPEEMPA